MENICENCGASFNVDTSQFKGGAGEVQCPNCSHSMLIAASPNADVNKSDMSAESAAAAAPSKRFLGLRGKMFLLFFLVPMLILIADGALLMYQMNSLSKVLSQETTKVVTDIAEYIIRQKALDVSHEVSIYLKKHPELTPEDFATDEEFLSVAVQKVGKSGYTVIDEGAHDGQPWINRAHPRKEIMGSDVYAGIKKQTSQEDFLRFKEQHDQAAKTQEMTTGYYRYLDNRLKFNAMAPIEGTHLWLIATTYLDEFTLPMRDLEEKVGKMTYETARIVIIIFAVIIFLIALAVIIYGARLSGNIKKLTDITNRISVGEVDVTVDLKAKDEIGDLAEAISRMQSSIMISLNRLRRKRNR